MRKTYVKPCADIVEVSTECLMTATSGLPISKDETLDDDILVGSKGHSFDLWADDEE